jgi:hypothetical protein
MARPSKPSRLDLLSKAIWPALGIGVAVAFGLFNTVWARLDSRDKQTQLDSLHRQIQAIEEQHQAALRKHKDQVRQAEEHAQRMRVEILKGLRGPAFKVGNSEPEQKAQIHVRVWFALLFAALRGQDAQRLGQDRAEELWHRARQQAEKEVQAQVVDWFI